MKRCLIIFLLVIFMMPLSIYAEQYGFVSISSGSNSPDLVNIREEAKSGSKVLDQIYFGTKVQVLGESGNWYLVNYGGKTNGYISKGIIELIPDYVSDPAYCESLKANGFDESYCPYLTYLHGKHPNWIFTANRINLSFDEIINGEEAKNLLQLDTSFDKNYFVNKYITSTQVMEGSNWYTATKEFSAYFLDPRNFLNERFIFMFEDLGCNENSYWRQNKDKALTAISNIFGSSSYLTTSMCDINGTPTSYMEVFYDAGLNNNISPISLATRVKQEGGSNETYGPVSGTVTSTINGYSVYGYYNYYNIGATAGGNPQMKGLLYACGPNCGKDPSFGRPWDTREKAIKGGAEFLSHDYIGIGQSNLYLQKFDLVEPNFYTHQYMSNITAPLSEGISAYLSYGKNNLVKTSSNNLDVNNEVPFNFSIPVFNNMGMVRDLPDVLDNVNTLDGIFINNELISGFDCDILEYSKYVINTTDSVKVSYQKSNSSTVTGDGDIKLDNNTTDVNLTVTAQNGSKRTYIIHLIKAEDTKSVSDIVNAVGVKVSENVFGDIKLNTAVSTIVSSINSISPLAKVEVMDGNGSLVSNTDLKTGYQVKITTVNGEEAIYQIAVNGDISGDGKIDALDLLKLQKSILHDTELSKAQNMAADTNNDNQINVLDLLRVQKHILGDINLGA